MFASQGLDAEGNVPDTAIASNIADGTFVDDFGELFSALPGMIDAFNQSMEEAQTSADQFGFDLFDGSTGTNQSMTSTGQITRSLTEDTGSALMGLWRRSLDEQKTQTGIFMKANGYLFEISANTLRTANNTDRLENMDIELQKIRENTKQIYLHDIGA
jgi:hypothetical protein